MTKTETKTKATQHSQTDFADVVQLIEAARKQAYQAVNTSLIELYWQVGAYISGKLAAAEWGDGVDAQSDHSQPKQAARRARVLPDNGYQGAMEQARTVGEEEHS
jgi:hypothetical protein